MGKRDASSIFHRLQTYMMNVWNKFDQVAYLLLIISVTLRTTLKSDKFMWARIFYCLTLATFFLRFMHVFFVNKNIGPKVIMIRRMLTDLLFFVAILIVFILAYGVASHALRFPNAPVSWRLLKDVVYLPYWQMYGELFLENVEGNVDNCNSTAGSSNPCPRKSWLAIILFAVYMIITNVLLLNLLIAMFSYTFEKVQENSEKVWRYYRYNLIYEYFDRPTLAPPLIFFSHIWRIFKYCKRKFRNAKPINHDFRKSLSREENNKMAAFERACMENFLLLSNKLNREQIHAKVTTAGEKIEKVIEELEQIKESVQIQTNDAQEANIPEPPPRATLPLALETSTTPR